jgi:hypothetical protein
MSDVAVQFFSMFDRLCCHPKTGVSEEMQEECRRILSAYEVELQAEIRDCQDLKRNLDPHGQQLLQRWAQMERNRLAASYCRNILARWNDARITRVGPTCGLPNEILLEIFSYFFTIFLHEERVKKCYITGIELAGVCRRWRNIIINTPDLWTNVHANVAWGSESDNHIPLKFFSILSHTLALSKERPLNVTLITAAPNMFDPCVSPGFRYIWSSCSRWRRLSLLVPWVWEARDYNFVLEAFTFGYLEQLEDITIEGCDSVLLDNLDLEEAPLSSIRLDVLEPCKAALDRSWPGVVQLDTNICHNLSKFPNVQHLKLHINQGTHWEGGANQMEVHSLPSSCYSLILVAGLSASHLQTFLARYRASFIKHLTVTSECNHRWNSNPDQSKEEWTSYSYNPLYAFLKTSGCSLTHLTFDKIAISSFHVFQLYHIVQDTLTDLTVSQCDAKAFSYGICEDNLIPSCFTVCALRRMDVSLCGLDEINIGLSIMKWLTLIILGGSLKFHAIAKPTEELSELLERFSPLLLFSRQDFAEIKVSHEGKSGFDGCLTKSISRRSGSE